MSTVLSKIKRGGDPLPPRVILSGPEGIGKSTFGAGAPAPLFVSAEDGLTGLDHVEALFPKSFDDVLDLVTELTTTDHKYKTLVFDTADWLERLIHRYISERDKKDGVEDYGYGKGYKVAETELVNLLTKLDTLRHTKKMGIIFLAHVHIRSFTEPGGEQWDRYEMKGHKGFTGILREWPDACLFAVYEVHKTKNKGENRERTIAGDRIIHTAWSPGWDAKNRLGLPEVIALDYDTFQAEVDANSPAKLRELYLALLKGADMPADERRRWEKVDVLTLDPTRVRGGIAKLQSLQKAA